MRKKVFQMMIILCVGVLSVCAQKKVAQPPRVPGMDYGTECDMPLFYQQLNFLILLFRQG